jgi:hypothetical protein
MKDSQSHIPSEIGISQFPASSRPRYRPSDRTNLRSPSSIDNLYTAIPPSNLDPYKKKNVLDPGYIHYDQDYYPGTVGTVDARGYLVTQGPKKRAAPRILQILCLGAGIPMI